MKAQSFNTQTLMVTATPQKVELSGRGFTLQNTGSTAPNIYFRFGRSPYNQTDGHRLAAAGGITYGTPANNSSIEATLWIWSSGADTACAFHTF